MLSKSQGAMDCSQMGKYIHSFNYSSIQQVFIENLLYARYNAWYHVPSSKRDRYSYRCSFIEEVKSELGQHRITITTTTNTAKCGLSTF